MDLRISEMLDMQRELQELHRGDWGGVYPKKARDQLLWGIGEIGEVITGAIPGRQNDKQRLLAASVGMSIEDVICADAVFKAAQRQNLGLVVDFENL